MNHEEQGIIIAAVRFVQAMRASWVDPTTEADQIADIEYKALAGYVDLWLAGRRESAFHSPPGSAPPG